MLKPQECLCCFPLNGLLLLQCVYITRTVSSVKVGET